MASKELQWTHGYDQSELDAWWQARGLPGQALRIPEFLKNSVVGNGRDVLGVYTWSPEAGKGVKDWKRKSAKDLSKEQWKQAAQFRNDLAKFTDPFREQSGLSKIAGGALGVASLALPPLAAMGAIAKAGNDAVGNVPPTEQELAAILEANHAANPDMGSGPLAAPAFNRERTQDPSNYLRYGMGPEHAFYRPAAPAPAVETPAPSPSEAPGSSPRSNFSSSLLNTIKDKYMARQGFADGGALSMVKHYPLRPKGRPSQELLNFASLPGQRSDPRIRIAVGDKAPLSQFVSRGTGAGGREDNIDAKLSENEYVIDAETVALLGDGSPEKGAKKLDDLRANIRRHKGGALSKGKISPDAKEGAEQYLAEGGRVGALKSFFKKKPKADPNGQLRRINTFLEGELARKSEPALGHKFTATPEQLEQDVMQLRREVGAQGGDTRPLIRKGGK